MRSRIQAVVLPSEPEEFRDEARRIFQELDRTPGEEVLAGECAPAIDVFETDEAVEIVVDLPGVSPASVRIVARGQMLLIAGNKVPRRTRPDASFHLVERGYGRFARVVQMSASCDTNRTRASMNNGELRISVPRTAERRGRSIRIAIPGEPPTA
jgi:HSP20 family protein